jgi:hypothetical protein
MKKRPEASLMLLFDDFLEYDEECKKIVQGGGFSRDIQRKNKAPE